MLPRSRAASCCRRRRASRLRRAQPGAARRPNPSCRSTAVCRARLEEPAPRALRTGLSLEQRSQRRDRLVEALPALLEGNAQGVVVALGRTRSKGGDQSALGEHIQSGERLCQRHGPPQDGERDRRGQRHVRRALDHARERGRPVEPGCREDEVVVGRDRREARSHERRQRPGRAGRAKAPRLRNCISGRWTPRSIGRSSQTGAGPKRPRGEQAPPEGWVCGGAPAAEDGCGRSKPRTIPLTVACPRGCSWTGSSGRRAQRRDHPPGFSAWQDLLAHVAPKTAPAPGIGGEMRAVSARTDPHLREPVRASRV